MDGGYKVSNSNNNKKPFITSKRILMRFFFLFLNTSIHNKYNITTRNKQTTRTKMTPIAIRRKRSCPYHHLLWTTPYVIIFTQADPVLSDVITTSHFFLGMKHVFWGKERSLHTHSRSEVTSTNTVQTKRD